MSLPREPEATNGAPGLQRDTKGHREPSGTAANPSDRTLLIRDHRGRLETWTWGDGSRMGVGVSPPNVPPSNPKEERFASELCSLVLCLEKYSAHF